jgi:hypothetical protein
LQPYIDYSGSSKWEVILFIMWGFLTIRIDTTVYFFISNIISLSVGKLAAFLIMYYIILRFSENYSEILTRSRNIIVENISLMDTFEDIQLLLDNLRKVKAESKLDIQAKDFLYKKIVRIGSLPMNYKLVFLINDVFTHLNFFFSPLGNVILDRWGFFEHVLSTSKDDKALLNNLKGFIDAPIEKINVQGKLLIKKKDRQFNAILSGLCTIIGGGGIIGLISSLMQLFG